MLTTRAYVVPAIPQGVVSMMPQRGINYTMTTLQLCGTRIKIASVCMLGQESQRHVRETRIKGKGREKEGTKNRIRQKG